MKRHPIFVMALLAVPALALAAQNPPSAPGLQTSAQPQKTAGLASKDYVIGAEDGLSIFVWREPDLSAKEVIVRPDGKITLPLINDIHAAGLTADQLQAQITEKLKDFIASPNVTVVVTKIMSQRVSIVGEVTTPGVYPLGSPTTVLELLARAGGFREFAKKKDITIMRQEGGRTIRFKFNFKDVSGGKNLDQNITLKSGDIVIVP